MYTGRMKLLLLALLAMGIATAQAPRGPMRVSKGVAQANRTKAGAPQYPQLARDARVQGTILLDVVIDKGGKVTNIKVLSGPAMLRQAALEAVQQWEYRPTLLNGQPVEIITDIEVNFTLE